MQFPYYSTTSASWVTSTKSIRIVSCLIVSSANQLPVTEKSSNLSFSSTLSLIHHHGSHSLKPFSWDEPIDDCVPQFDIKVSSNFSWNIKRLTKSDLNTMSTRLRLHGIHTSSKHIVHERVSWVLELSHLLTDTKSISASIKNLSNFVHSSKR